MSNSSHSQLSDVECAVEICWLNLSSLSMEGKESRIFFQILKKVGNQRMLLKPLQICLKAKSVINVLLLLKGLFQQETWTFPHSTLIILHNCLKNHQNCLQWFILGNHGTLNFSTSVNTLLLFKPLFLLFFLFINILLDLKHS